MDTKCPECGDQYINMNTKTEQRRCNVCGTTWYPGNA